MIYPVPKIIKSIRNLYTANMHVVKMIWFDTNARVLLRPVLSFSPSVLIPADLHLHAEASTVDPGSQAYYIPIR